MRLQGKIALVTGGSRGIGRAIALDMASEGAEVILTYKTNSALAEEVVNAIVASGGNAAACQMDVTSRTAVINLAGKVKASFGSIDILVNNAGINIPNDFDKISEDDWNTILDTNVTSVFRMGQEFLPVLKNGGSIINISSVSGQYGGPRSSHYAVSKAGMISLTHNMAIFCAHRNIRVNAVAPGLIETKMAGAANQLGLDEKILLKRRGHVDEVAKVVSFLASDAASYITAQVINVNGGLYF